jgi:hypothetical protein
LKFAVTGGVGSGTNAVYKEDAPFSWLSTLQFLDVNSSPIIFQITGYDLYLLVKYGGFFRSSDPKNSPFYSQGGLGGNSQFILPLPLEIRSRDGLGSLPNKNNSTAFKVTGTIATTGDVFSTLPAPTVPTLATLSLIMEAWWEPQAADLKGRPQAQVPPGNNTVAYISKQVINHSAGSVTHKFSRVGYLFRNFILVQRDNNGARATASFPNPATLIYEGQNLTIQDRDLLRHMNQQDFGYTAAAEAANGLDNGVFVFPFNKDFTNAPGDEIGAGYLGTTAATRWELQGVAATAGTLTALTNDVSARDQMEITG